VELPRCATGVAEAQNEVGYELFTTNSSTRDYRKAARWFSKAAVQGYAIAQANLGALYAEGRGVPLDYSEAFFWLKAASSAGTRRQSTTSINCSKS